MEAADRNRSETVVELVGRLLGGRGEEASLGRGDGQDLIPGVFFTLLATSWFYQHLARSTRRKSMPPPSRLVRLMAALPWDGVTGLVLSGLAILASVLGHGVAQREGRGSAALAARVTLYLAFSLPGLLSTLAFYWAKGRTALPRHTALLATCLAFLLELTLPPADSPFLLLTIAACALLSCCRLLLSPSPASPSSLLLALLTQSQGSWLLHCSLAPPPAVWAPTYFAWHLLAIYSTYTALFLGMQLIGRAEGKQEKPTSPPPSCTASSSGHPASSSSTTLSSYSPAPHVPARPGRESELFYEQEVNDTKIEKIRCVLATIDHMMDRQEGEAGGSSLDTSQDTLGEEEARRERGPENRVSPLEEWNTLHHCVRENRASIRLKESSIV